MRTYDDFTARVRETGLYILSENPWGLPSLWQDTKDSPWHTGIFDEDPWKWKNRIAADGIAYYGHVAGGRLCFISMEWLPLFFAAFRHAEDIEERYFAGEVDRRALDIVRLFREMPCMPVYALRQKLGVPGKEKGKLNGAVLRLEKEMILSIGADTQRLNRLGEPYGWSVNEHRLTEAFYTAQLDASQNINPRDAQAQITALCEKLGGKLSQARFFTANPSGIDR